ncbi:hypothetical protein FSP39_009983 [Pinctada imbricata]|uniref:Serine/threonine/tyrosine-interacting protein n=1 Tax=Pinctada imbricata TaxID=66713 RepID=A0AA89BSV1_PINIB|nr:hypothetical protein FSP39_009983 [Pinctada imbricata]
MEELSFPPVPSEIHEVDWEYTMRREMQEILPNLYLGPYAAAMKSKVRYWVRFEDLISKHQGKLSILQNLGITDIICIRHHMEASIVKPNFPQHFRYLVLDIADEMTENIIPHFRVANSFLEECFSKGGKALVHGNAGISRSAAIVIAFVMEKFGLPYRDSFLYVQQRRFCVCPNEGFVQQLTEYEPMYRARLHIQNGHRSEIGGYLKRKHEDDADDDIDDMMLPT